MLAISVSEKQTDAEHVTEVAQAVADRMKRAGATIYFVNVYQPGHHFAYSITQGVFFVLGVLGYLTVLLSGIPDRQHHHRPDDPANAADRHHESHRRRHIADLWHVPRVDPGLWPGRIIDRDPAGKCGRANHRRRHGGMVEFPVRTLSWVSSHLSSSKSFVALIVPLLAAIFPIYNSVRVTVREAISDYGLGGNAKPKERFGQPKLCSDPAPDPHFAAQHLPAQSQAWHYPLHAGAGRSDIHRGLQPVGFLRQGDGRYSGILPGRYQHLL